MKSRRDDDLEFLDLDDGKDDLPEAEEDQDDEEELFDEELAIIKEIGMKYADEFVAYDEMFNGLTGSISYLKYSLDGVHPTHRGSRLIADTAIKAIRKHLL